MAICMAGIDHTKANLDVRSVFSLTKKKMAQAYEAFLQRPGIDGCVLLSTCNRMEIWLSGSEEAVGDPVYLLCEFLNVDPEMYTVYFRVRTGESAVSHLFRLAAGLESRIIGEDQILTQVGDALVYARSCAATDHTLEVLLRLAVTAGKRVKTETVLSTADRSVIHTALKQLEGEGITVEGKTCMVIGNGMMGRLTAQTLLEHGADVTVTVRQYRSGIVDIPRECKRINYDDRMQLFPECDLVFSATSSPNYTLRLEQMENLSMDHIMPMIDLAVPRDIEPEIGRLPWARLYDIDSFHIDLEASRTLKENLKKAEEILEEEKKEFYDWYEGRDLVPRIQHMKETIGKDVRGRMVPALRQAHLEKEEKAAMEESIARASSNMMNRLLFGLKEKLSDQEFAHCLDAMEEMFP